MSLFLPRCKAFFSVKCETQKNEALQKIPFLFTTSIVSFFLEIPMSEVQVDLRGLVNNLP